MKYKKFDVVIVPFPFVDNVKKQKIRPAIVVSDNEYNKLTGLVVVAMVTSAKKSKLHGDILIKYDFLKADCVIRMKFASFAQETVFDKIGALDKSDISNLQSSLIEIFA